MKTRHKILTSLFIFTILFSCVSVPYSSSNPQSVLEDSWVDRAGDWFATLGKSQAEKDQILTQRRSRRINERVQNTVHRNTGNILNSFKSTSNTTNRSMSNSSNTLNKEIQKLK